MVDIDVRTLLDNASLKVQRVYGKHYSKLVQYLTKSLSYDSNPNFSVYSAYTIDRVMEQLLRDMNSDLRLTAEEQIEFSYYIGIALGLKGLYDSTGTSYTFKSLLEEAPTYADTTALARIKSSTVRDLTEITKVAQLSTQRLIQDLTVKHFNVSNLVATGRDDLVKIAIQDIKGKVLKEAVEKNLVAVVDSRGRKWKLNTYVDVVVQTYAHRMYVNGLKDFAGATGKGDLAKIPYNASTTDACMQFQNMVISMTGQTAGYMTYDQLANTGHIFHPRCRHHPIPYWDETQIPPHVLRDHNSVLTSAEQFIQQSQK